VSTATAYNHFKSKQALIGHAYAPLLKHLTNAIDSDIANRADPIAAIRRHISDLTALVRRYPKLTAALVEAIREQSQKAGDTTELPKDDVRQLVPLPALLSKLINYGQERGILLSKPSAEEFGRNHTEALLNRVVTSPEESVSDTVSAISNDLLRALVVNSNEMDESLAAIQNWSSEGDLSRTLTRLRTREFANNELTKEYLEAGYRLSGRKCIPTKISTGADSGEINKIYAFFERLSIGDIVREVDETTDLYTAPETFYERWSSLNDYIIDLLAYSLRNKKWRPQVLAAEESAGLISTSTDPVQTAHEISYQVLQGSVDDSAVLLSLIMAVVAGGHPELRETMGEAYEANREIWIPICEEVLAVNELALRPDVTVHDIVEIFFALSDGIAFRIRSDPNAESRFIDHEHRHTLLGKAALAVLIACIDPGSGLSLEGVIRQLIEVPREDSY
jgi:AcrR family transcriptional regulator